jgi:hypothetical protein
MCYLKLVPLFPRGLLNDQGLFPPLQAQRSPVCPSFSHRAGDSRNHCPVLFSAILDIILVSLVRAVFMVLRKFLESNYQLRSQEIAPFRQKHFLFFGWHSRTVSPKTILSEGTPFLNDQPPGEYPSPPW